MKLQKFIFQEYEHYKTDHIHFPARFLLSDGSYYFKDFSVQLFGLKVPQIIISIYTNCLTEIDRQTNNDNKL